MDAISQKGHARSHGVAASRGGARPGMTVDVFGMNAYQVDCHANRVAQYRIELDGKLSPLAPATVATGTGPACVAMEPSGMFAYVPNTGSNDVSQYWVELDGCLVPMSIAAVDAGLAPSGISFDTEGRYAYVSHRGSKQLRRYAIGDDGHLLLEPSI